MQASLALTALMMGLAGGPHCVAMCGAACGAVVKEAKVTFVGRRCDAAAAGTRARPTRVGQA